MHCSRTCSSGIVDGGMVRAVGRQVLKDRKETSWQVQLSGHLTVQKRLKEDRSPIGAQQAHRGSSAEGVQ